MNLKIFITLRVILLIHVTSAEFNLNTLNTTTNKSLDTLNQNRITLNTTRDYNNDDNVDDDEADNQFNDNYIIDNNNDTVSKFKILEQQKQLFKEKLNLLLKTATITATKQKSFEKKETVSEPKIYYLQRLPLNYNIENNTFNDNNDYVEGTNKTNHDNETISSTSSSASSSSFAVVQQLNNDKLKTNFKGFNEENGRMEQEEEEEKEEKEAETTLNDQFDIQQDKKNVEQTTSNDYKTAAEERPSADEENVENYKGIYQTKYYAAPATTSSLSSALLFGQLPQLQLQPQTMQLYLQQQQEQQQQTAVSILPQEYYHLSDYRFLFNAERHTEFFLHTLTRRQQQRNYAVSATTEATFESHEDTTESEENFPLLTTTTTPLPAITDNGLGEKNEKNPADNVMVNRTNARVLNVVTDTIGAVFGVNTRPVAGIQGIHTEEIELYNGLSLRQSRFNPFNPCRILIHGWLGGSKAGIYNTLVPEYLKLEDGSYNIITVDWGKGALADYITASYRVKPVGMVVAKFIDFLHRETGIAFANIHVIGFSMGAHIAGIAGKFVQTGRLRVIYGLDPALPLFRYENINERLDIKDADYVEIVHTSVGSYGYDHPLGHVDFYVNYGYNQPGCFFNECSHFRAFQVYAETLRNEMLEGTECFGELWLDMIKFKRCMKETGKSLNMGVEGLTADQMASRRGLYFVSTNAQPPYRMVLRK